MTLLTTIFAPDFFLKLITWLFAFYCIRNAIAQDWNQAAYAVGAVVLNLSIIWR